VTHLHLPMLPPAVVSRLRCPTCGRQLSETSNGLKCALGHVTPCHSGYVDARPLRPSDATEATFRSFGYEWTRFNRLHPEDESHWNNYFADVNLSKLEGGVGLDAGCGSGRYSVFTARHVAALVALDGSDAVSAAASNLACCPTVTVVRADLRDPPLAPASFDFVSCLGVLHHLENPREGFDALAKLLAPGGMLLVYLYSRPCHLCSRLIALSFAHWCRRFSTGIPRPLLRGACWPVALLLWIFVVRLGAMFTRGRTHNGQQLPLGAYRGQPVRSLWLDTFDRLSAPIEHRYAWEEISSWYAETGLKVDALRDESGLFILAHRPR
jgi:SAM-dependent methyltransferase